MIDQLNNALVVGRCGMDVELNEGFPLSDGREALSGFDIGSGTTRIKQDRWEGCRIGSRLGKEEDRFQSIR